MTIPTNGAAPRSSGTSGSERCPRRLVLLEAGDDSSVLEVLAEYRAAEISGDRLHADLQRLSAAHPGRMVAAEWLGKLGWTRFLWCKK